MIWWTISLNIWMIWGFPRETLKAQQPYQPLRIDLLRSPSDRSLDFAKLFDHDLVNWRCPKVSKMGVSPKSSTFIGFTIESTIHCRVLAFVETPRCLWNKKKKHHLVMAWPIVGADTQDIDQSGWGRFHFAEWTSSKNHFKWENELF